LFWERARTGRRATLRDRGAAVLLLLLLLLLLSGFATGMQYMQYCSLAATQARLKPRSRHVN